MLGTKSTHIHELAAIVYQPRQTPKTTKYGQNNKRNTMEKSPTDYSHLT